MSYLKIFVSIILIIILSLPSCAAQKPAKKSAHHYKNKIVKTVKIKKQHKKTKKHIVKKYNKARPQAAKKIKVVKTVPVKQAIPQKVSNKISKSGSGEIVVYSRMKDLDVYIDEDMAGKTPLNLGNIKAGKHIVEAYSGPKLLYRQYIEVRDRDTVVISVDDNKQIDKEDPDFVI